VGETNELGDLQDCGEGEDKCFVRYYMDPETGTPKDGKVSRYCSSTATCITEGDVQDYFSIMTTNHHVVAKCCGAEGCNAGTPAKVAPGTYWIQTKGSDKYVTSDKDGLSEKEFSNLDNQKFDIAQVPEPGSDLEGMFSIAPHGVLDDEGSQWTMSEVGKDTYMITGQTSMGFMPIVGRDFFAKFKITATVGGNWEVGWKDKRCPEDASRAIPSAKDPTTCMNKCKQDAACKEIIEWDNDNNRCFFVTQDCPQDALRDGVGFFVYKSKCAGVECAAISQCHLAGTCDVTNGQCSTPLMADDAACDDGDFTTTSDVCKAGTCTGVNLCAGVTCTANSQCHDVGLCNYETGECEEKFKPGGAPCDDEDTQTKDDVCNAGVCKGTNPCEGVTCEALDQCHEPGVCLFETGVCDDKRKPDGTSCDDDDSTTKDDKCIAGVCRGKGKCEDVTCAAMGPCYVKGTCDPETGRCDDPFAEQGAVCDDESDFTVDDVCDGKGECFGTDLCAAVSCADMILDQCMAAGACNRNTGECESQPKQNGVSCDDGDDKTVNDVCVFGECKGTDLCKDVVCAPINSCHEAGECNAETGVCVDNVREDGDPCDDEQDFTDDDECHAGVCVGKQFAQEEPDWESDWFEEAQEVAKDQVTVLPKMVSALGQCTKLYTNWEPTAYKKGKTKALKKHNVQCPPNQVMKGWKLKKDKKKKMIQIKYICCDLSMILGECKESDSGFADHEKGKSWALASHMAVCNQGSVMAGWQMQKSGKAIKMIYNCCGVESPLDKCVAAGTGETKDNGRVQKLWKHKAMCKKGSVMTGWKYVHTGPKKKKKGKVSIKYDCCEVPEVPETLVGLIQNKQRQSLTLNQTLRESTIDLHDHLGPYEEDEDEFGEEEEDFEDVDMHDDGGEHDDEEE